MALDREDQARLRRIQRQLAAEDPDCEQRIRDYSELLAGNRRRTAEPAPWTALLLIWALVVAAAVILVAATAGAA